MCTSGKRIFLVNLVTNIQVVVWHDIKPLSRHTAPCLVCLTDYLTDDSCLMRAPDGSFCVTLRMWSQSPWPGAGSCLLADSQYQFEFELSEIIGANNALLLSPRPLSVGAQLLCLNDAVGKRVPFTFNRKTFIPISFPVCLSQPGASVIMILICFKSLIAIIIYHYYYIVVRIFIVFQYKNRTENLTVYYTQGGMRGPILFH